MQEILRCRERARCYWKCQCRRICDVKCSMANSERYSSLTRCSPLVCEVRSTTLSLILHTSSVEAGTSTKTSVYYAWHSSGGGLNAPDPTCCHLATGSHSRADSTRNSLIVQLCITFGVLNRTTHHHLSRPVAARSAAISKLSHLQFVAVLRSHCWSP